MGIQDRNILWKKKKIHINVVDFSDIIGTAGVNTGLAAGTPLHDEISSFSLAGVDFPDANDVKQHYMVLPYDLDANIEIGFRILWTSGSSETADDLTWLIKCDLLAESATLIAATTALDTVIVEDAVTGAYDLQWTARGIKNAGTLTQAEVDAGAVMSVAILLSAIDAGLTEETFPLVLEMDYGVRACE